MPQTFKDNVVSMSLQRMMIRIASVSKLEYNRRHLPRRDGWMDGWMDGWIDR